MNMLAQPEISERCQLPAYDQPVLDSTMHYLSAGEGKPLLFIHGIPTSSFLWRNIIPTLAPDARCLAVDLMGMGKSGKPPIAYTQAEHVRYLEAFINALNLTDITLVLHGWGSVIGFDYAARHPERIAGLVFFESHIRPVTDWQMLSLPVQQFASLLQNKQASYQAIVKHNYLVEKLLPSGVIRSLSDTEMATYRAPFAIPESRLPLWQYVQELPLGDRPTPVLEVIQRYTNWLTSTPIPKLMLYAVPGFITTMETVVWARDHLSALTQVGLDDVLHFAQESVPGLFAEELQRWYRRAILA